MRTRLPEHRPSSTGLLRFPLARDIHILSLSLRPLHSAALSGASLSALAEIHGCQADPIESKGDRQPMTQLQERIDSERRPVAGRLRAKRQASFDLTSARGLEPRESLLTSQGDLTILGRSYIDLGPSPGIRSGSY